jgi:hypothetical protein
MERYVQEVSHPATVYRPLADQPDTEGCSWVDQTPLEFAPSEGLAMRRAYKRYRPEMVPVSRRLAVELELRYQPQATCLQPRNLLLAVAV